MKFFRFSTTDENYTLSSDAHCWELPLQLEHTKVGLSSLYIELDKSGSSHSFAFYLNLTCNLLDRTLENPRAILGVVPLSIETYGAYTSRANQIGLAKQTMGRCS